MGCSVKGVHLVLASYATRRQRLFSTVSAEIVALMPLISGRFRIERFPGKGGWTYVPLPVLAFPRAAEEPALNLLRGQNLPFGWVVVDGTIDDVRLHQVKLMGPGNGRHFLALNAKLRKRFGKAAGDEVTLLLIESVTASELTDELRACFAEAPKSPYTRWPKLPATTRKRHLDRIYATADSDRRAE